MSPVRFALLAFVSSSSLVHGGLVITLVPEVYLPYPHMEPIRVEVFAQLDADSPPSILLRGLQLNLSDSSAGLHITTPVTHPPAFGEARFWDFSSSLACMTSPDTCGDHYFVDGSLTDDHNLVIAYWFFNQSASHQLRLTQNAPTHIGVLDVQINDWGVFDLDVLNAHDPVFLNDGSWMAFGFGTDSDPAITWSAYEGTITGRQLRFIIPEPGTLALLLLGTACLTTKNTKCTKRCSSRV